MDRRRLLMLQQKQEGLPSGYTKLEYLQSSGTQCINTEIYPTENAVIESVISRPSGTTLSGAVYGCGNVRSTGYPGVNLFINGNVFAYRFGNTALATAVKMEYEKKYNTALAFKKLTVNDEIYTTSAETRWEDMKEPLYLFCRRYPNENANLINNARIHEIKIHEQGVVIDLVPCLDADGVPCMFDTVKRKTFYNAGTGDFLWG